MTSLSSNIHFAIPNGLSNRPGARPEPSTPGPTPAKHTLFHILTPSTEKQKSRPEKGRLGEHNGDRRQDVSTVLASTTPTRKHAGTLSSRDVRRGNGDDGDNVHSRSGDSHHGQSQDLSHMYMVGQKIQELFSNPRLSDVTIVIGDRKFPAHLTVLSIFTPYFIDKVRSNKQEVHISSEDYDQRTVERFLKFCYGVEGYEKTPDKVYMEGNRIFYWFRLHFRLLQFATEFSVAVLRENALVEARNCLSHLCKHPRAIINEHGAPGYLHQILQAIYGGGRSPAKPSSSSTISTTTTTATATSTSTRICSSSSSSGSSTSGSRDESPDIPILLSPITRMSSGYGLQEMLVGIMVKMLPNVVDGKRSEREEKLKGMLAAFPGFAAEVVMEMARRDVVANNSNRENEKNNVASEDRIVRVKRERERGRERERDRDRARAESTDKKSKRSRPD